LKSSGIGEQVQAEVEYSTFLGGPPLLEAFNAGAIDLGYVGDTPPILAQARDQDIVIVGAWRFSGKVLAVVAPPGKDISSVADLKGKRFAYPRGTALQAFALRALEEVGLTEGDIENVDVPAIDVIGVLRSGDVDAAVVVEPLLTGYLRDNPEATVVRDAEGLTTGLQLLITTSEVLADPAKAAAVGDYVERLAESFVWRAENPEEAAQAFADLNQISLEEAQAIADRNGTQLFVPLDDGVIGPLQELADLFYAAGAIPEPVDVSLIFDDRFDPYVLPYT
jgi:sulfonate transport system substrate-binding protein